MITSLLEWAGHLVVTVISQAGYPGILLLMGAESACIPLPSEIVMPFSGYLVFVGRFRLGWVALIGAVGCNVGSIVAYYVGARGGRPLAEKYGHYLWITRHDLEIADRWFERYGGGAVFVARLLPIVRTFIALPAGIARMDFLRFNIYTFLGSLPWCWALAFAGLKLGRNWPILRVYFHRFDAAILAALAAGFAWLIYGRWKGRV